MFDSLLVDLRDHDGIEALAKRENVDLIYSIGSYTAMPVLAIVPPRLRLQTFLRQENVEITMNKLRLGDLLISHNLSVVPYREVKSEADLLEPYRTVVPDVGLRLQETEKLVERVLCLPNGNAVSISDIMQICDIIRFTQTHSKKISELLSSGLTGSG